MKQKRVLLCCLLLMLGILLMSCQQKSDASASSTEVNTEANTKSKSTLETTSATTAPEEPVVLDENTIKQSVLSLMEKSETQEDPSELFSAFAGDFTVSGFPSGGLKEIKRKNAVTVVTHPQTTYYGIEAAGFLFYVADYSGESEVIGDQSLFADAADHSTIFTCFCMDTSAVYAPDEDDTPSPTLTADLLTVNKEKSACTFAKSYLDAFAKDIVCAAMGYTSAQTNSFLSKYEGSSVYSVAENKITFEFKIKDASLGNLHYVASYATDANDRVNVYSYVEYSNPSLGLTKPMITEIQYKDVVYRENQPISATIQYKSITDTSFYDGAYPNVIYIDETTEINASFTLDLSNPSAPKATANYQTINTSKDHGTSYSTKTDLKMTLDLSKSSSQFVFEETSDGETTQKLTANKVVFQTPASFPAVPERVTDAITEHIMTLY
jgi:hypothetical protein